MLEVGVARGKGLELNLAETRTHFGAWVIVSSPLTLSHDVNDGNVTEMIWPIISNREVLAVSQTYAGFSGGPFKSSTDEIVLGEIDYSQVDKYMTEEEIKSTGPHKAPAWQYFYKPLNYEGTETAVLLINHDTGSQDLHLSLADVPGMKGPCKVRDLWNRKDLGEVKETTVFTVGSHDSVFLKLSGCTAAKEETLLV